MPNRINKASLPPNVYRLLSMIFSNVMDRAIIFRASDRSRKKVKFREIFRDKFAKKSANFTGILGENFAKKHAQSVKNGRFCGYFQGKFARNQSMGFALIRPAFLTFF